MGPNLKTLSFLCRVSGRRKRNSNMRTLLIKGQNNDLVTSERKGEKRESARQRQRQRDIETERHSHRHKESERLRERH